MSHIYTERHVRTTKVKGRQPDLRFCKAEESSSPWRRRKQAAVDRVGGGEEDAEEKWKALTGRRSLTHYNYSRFKGIQLDYSIA